MSKPARKPGQPSESPSTSRRTRDRCSSLSIARSPSVLSSTVLTSPADPDADSSFPFFAGPGGSSSLGLTRTVSHPPAHRHVRTKSQLSDIPSDEDLSVVAKTDSEEDHTVELVDEDLEDRHGDGGTGYSGDFQRPDGKEMVGILLSLAGVGLLALAAGLTTVFDWVL